MNKPTIGVIGGGQLGKMLLESGIKWNLKFNVLESESSNSICNKLAHTIIRGNLHDKDKIRELADISDILTFELENIDVDVLVELENMGKKIIPRPHILKIIQNKYVQKKFYRDNGISTSHFEYIDDLSNLQDLFDKFNCEKLVLKSCVGGYDGYGVCILDKGSQVNLSWNKKGQYIVEEFIDCSKEVSVIVAVDTKGNTKTYPLVETVFNNRNVLDYQICPVHIDNELRHKIETLAVDAVIKFKSPGLFAVEMFLSKDGRVLVNEISPRPHNTGHHTIECCTTSQFEQLNRILLGLPLGYTHIHTSSLMVNILGPNDFKGDYTFECPDELFETGHLHSYGKTPTKPGRKLGHITIVGDNLLEKKDKIVSKLRIKPIRSENKCERPQIGVIMGSISDYPVMKSCCEILDQFSVPYEKHVVSAHRTPDKMYDYAKKAKSRGLKVIIAGAGGAAHLPGMCASLTTVPVIGVPIKTSTLSGMDSLYSIVQMPKGVPVATVAINGSINAGLLAVEMLGTQDKEISDKLIRYKNELQNNVRKMEEELSN